TAATFTVDADGRAWVVVSVPTELEITRQLIVTEEAAPGSPAPTGPPLLEARQWRGVPLLPSNPARSRLFRLPPPRGIERPAPRAGLGPTTRRRRSPRSACRRGVACPSGP